MKQFNLLPVLITTNMAQHHEKIESWPGLKGKTFEEAEEVIKNDRQDVEVIRLLEGSPTTRDYRLDRVWVFVNEEGIVVCEPRTG